MPKVRWTTEAIRAGIDRFKEEKGHFPTAFDFDRADYLPSARQIQRAFGGLEALRTQLGYKELNYTKGVLRRTRSLAGHNLGISAEDALEKILIDHFGELFVHTQKRYHRDHKNRYDFFVYYSAGYMGIDIFTTSRIEYIGPNIRHKITKYKNVPATTPIFFIVASEALGADEVKKGASTARVLETMPNIVVLHLTEFIAYATTLQPLLLPPTAKRLLEDTERM